MCERTLKRIQPTRWWLIEAQFGQLRAFGSEYIKKTNISSSSLKLAPLCILIGYAKPNWRSLHEKVTMVSVPAFVSSVKVPYSLHSSSYFRSIRSFLTVGSPKFLLFSRPNSSHSAKHVHKKGNSYRNNKAARNRTLRMINIANWISLFDMLLNWESGFLINYGSFFWALFQ